MPAPTRIRLTSVLVVVAAFASGCATAVADTDAGISGHAELGPLCPVQRPGKPCTRPYQTTLIVYTARHHRRVRKLHTDRHGRFHIDVAPGHYIIAGPHTGTRYPAAQDVRVTVRPHRVTHVTVSFDTGIR
jgi:hypothetical protein